MQRNVLNRHAYSLLKGQVNERSTNPDKFNEFISIHNCTFIILSVVHGGGGGGGEGVTIFLEFM